MEERHASPDGGVEAPVLAQVRPEHPEPPLSAFFLRGAQHLPRLACFETCRGQQIKLATYFISSGGKAVKRWITCFPGRGVDAVASPQQRADEPRPDVTRRPRHAHRRRRGVTHGGLLFSLLRRAAADASHRCRRCLCLVRAANAPVTQILWRKWRL